MNFQLLLINISQTKMRHIPIELVNHILSFRPSHPVGKLLMDELKQSKDLYNEMYSNWDDDEKSEITLLKYYNDVRCWFDIERLKFNNYYLIKKLRMKSDLKDILRGITFDDGYSTRIKKLLILCNIDIYKMTKRLGKVPNQVVDDYTEIYNFC